MFILSENPFTSLLTDSLRKGALLQSKSRSSISQIDFLMSNPMNEKSKIKEQFVFSFNVNELKLTIIQIGSEYELRINSIPFIKTFE